jgi:hypothetical protein
MQQRSFGLAVAFVLGLSACPGPSPVTGVEDAGFDAALVKVDTGSGGGPHDGGRHPNDGGHDAQRPRHDSGVGDVTTVGDVVTVDTGVDGGIDASDGGAPCSSPSDCPSGICNGGVCAPETLAVNPTMLQFTSTGSPTGFVACGSSPTTQTFTVAVNGTASLMWWATFGLGAATPYQISPSCTAAMPCTVTPGTPVTVTVTGPAVPANAGITTYDDTVTVFSSSPGDMGQAIQLSESSYGAILAFDPTDVNFGSPLDTSASKVRVTVLNSGNVTVPSATVSLTPSSSSEFSISSGPLNIPVAGAMFTVGFAPNDSTASATGAVALSLGTDAPPLCAPLPPNLTLEGQGTLPISVTPSLNFNTEANNGVGVSCGSSPTALNVVVTNNGSAAAGVTGLSLALGTSYTVPTVSPAAPINVPAGGSVNIPVTPDLIPSSYPPGLVLNDTLTVTTNAPGDSPHTVTLTETTAGAVLTLVPPVSMAANTPSVVFSSTPVGSTSTYPIVVENSGNLAANFTLTTAPPFSFNNGSFTAPAGGVASPIASFTPTVPSLTGPTTGAAKLLVPATTPLCSSSPTSYAILMQGVGTTTNAYSVGPATLAFGATTCGVNGNPGVQPPGLKVTLTNPTLASVSFSATLGGPGASHFSVAPATGTITSAVGAGMPATTSVTVTPNALGAMSSITPAEAQFGIFATLTIVIGGSSGDTFVIPITETIAGAYLVWAPSALDVLPGGGTANFALRNLGTTQAPVDLSFGSATGFVFTAPPGNPPSGIVAPGGSLPATIQDNNAQRSPATVTAVVTDTAVPVCSPTATLPVDPN